MARKKRKTAVARRRRRSTNKPWYKDHTGKLIAVGTGLALVLIPEPVSSAAGLGVLTLTGLGIITSVLGAAGIQASKR
jgi:hypothetical protein